MIVLESDITEDTEIKAKRPRGGGGGVGGYGLTPWPCLGKEIPKIHTLFGTTPSILLFIILTIAIEQIHIIGFCLLGVQTKFILQIKSIVQAIPCWQNYMKLYALVFYRTEK